jgi:anaerobic selenocysteine-containing dehydrogenase
MSASPVKTIVTTCTRDCPDACGILAEVRDGRLAGLRGNPAHPITRGFLCRRSRDFIRRVYSPNRVTTPLRRVDGSWKRISWNDALDLAAERIGAYRDTYGPLSILHYQENGSTAGLKLLNQRFFNLLGGATTVSGSLCGGAGIAGQTMDFGQRTAHEPTDITNSRLIILWGRNPMATNVHLVPFLRNAKARGAKLVLIDPLRTRTAHLCDLHYQPVPGSDGYLAAAMAKVILEEGLADRGFVEAHTEGFAEYLSALESYSTEWLAGQCGIGLAAIRELALLYATSRPAAIWTGWGLQRREYGAEIYRLVDALAALTGNIGIPGGGVNHGMEEREYWDWGLVATETARATRAIPRPVIGEGILQANDPPIKMIVVTCGNPATQAPDSLRVRQAFQRAEFVMLVDTFLTDTADLAHLFLPATSPFEEEDLVGSYTHHWLGPVNPAIEPVGEARPDLRIFQGLAERLGIAGMEGSTKEWLRRLAAPLEPIGLSLEQLQAGPVRPPVAREVAFADRQFPTDSRRFRFTNTIPENPATGGHGRFVLLSTHPDRSVHAQILPEDQGELLVVRMNPADAARLSLSKGEEVVLSAGEGRLKARLALDSTIAPGVLHCFQGGWIKFGAGVNQVVPDILTHHGLCAGFYEAIVDVAADSAGG